MGFRPNNIRAQVMNIRSPDDLAWRLPLKFLMARHEWARHGRVGMSLVRASARRPVQSGVSLGLKGQLIKR